MQLSVELRKKMEAVLAHLSGLLKQVRTGRAHPGIVEGLVVEAYGSQNPLKGLASISTPDPHTILISPWDKGLVKDIEKAILTSKLGLSPAVVGSDIRLKLPDLTAERREELVKLINTEAEQTRVALRTLREEFLKEKKAAVEAKTASEDELTRAKKEVQVLIDEMNNKVELLVKDKTQQIRTV
ncbi:MAG: ribosome recycling factor [Parcubacteria group bacterium]